MKRRKRLTGFLLAFSMALLALPPLPLAAQGDWQADAGWNVSADGNGPVFRLKDTTEAKIQYTGAVGGADGIHISYDLAFDDPAVFTSSNICLKLPADGVTQTTETWLFIRVQGGSNSILVQGQIQSENQWETLFSTPDWVAGTGTSLRVELNRQAGEDTLSFAVYSQGADTAAYAAQVEDARLTGEKFYDKGLQLVLGSDSGAGIITYSNLHVGLPGGTEPPDEPDPVPV
ncbi:MAG TPA: hypothetical protein H9674_02965, partial [Firmicutes bacterium]|nr:hypothetical protein [Bacillota bacterium]